MSDKSQSGTEMAVTLTDVTFAYDRTPVVHRVNLAFSSGSINAIVGPNGSGKSTIAGLLTGMLEPRSGDIKIFGRPLSAIGNRDRSRFLSLAPQKLACPFDYSVNEFVRMARYHRVGQTHSCRLPASDADAVQEAMQLAGVEYLSGRAFNELSVGEQQRVAIARVLAQDTPIVALDEPTSALDIEHQLSLLTLIHRIKVQGGCVIWITHDLHTVFRSADRVMVLSEGSVAAAGPPESALRDEVLESVFHVRRGTQPQPAFELQPRSAN